MAKVSLAEGNLQRIREYADEEFSKIFQRVSKLARQVDVEPVAPRAVGTSKFRPNAPHLTAE